MNRKKGMLYGGIVLVILLGYGYFLSSGNLGRMFSLSGGNPEAKVTELEQLHTRLLNQVAAKQQLDKRMTEVATLSRSLHPSTYTVNDLQSEVDQVARVASLSYSNLRSIGNATSNLRGSDEVELISSVEVSISGQVELPALTRFIERLERRRPVVFWTSCNITPRHNQGSRNQVFLSARLRAYMLTPEGERVLAGLPPKPEEGSTAAAPANDERRNRR